jgi:hypothetical protein
MYLWDYVCIAMRTLSQIFEVDLCCGLLGCDIE